MKRLTFKVLCLILAFVLIIAASCGCRLVDSHNLPSSSKTTSLDKNSTVSSNASSSYSKTSKLPTSSVEKEPFDPDRTYGNTSGNLNNSGLASIQGKWIYYGTNTGVYKTKTDQSKTVRLCEAVSGVYINVSGAWVYFIDNISSSIYRVRTDGIGFQKFGNVKAKRLFLVNGWVYYTTENISSPLYRTPIDDFKPQTVISEKVYDLCIQDGKIFYKYDMQLYAAELDGSNPVCYGNLNTQGMLFYKGYKYGTGSLEKEKIDGSDSQVLVPNGAFNVTIDNDWIYYTLDKSLSSHKLYKMKIDGTNNQLLSNSYCSNVSVVGDWIYFHKGVNIIEFSENSAQVTLKPYKMKIDGTQLQELN